MRKTISILAAAIAATALSACASHKELRAPCANDNGAISALLSHIAPVSVAFASDVACGPMVRQDGVSIL